MGSLLSALRKMAGSKKDVRQVQMQQTDEDPVSSPASVVLSGISLPSCVIEQILLHLPLKDVHLCMTVCKSWYGLLQRNSFWKKYIPMHYDLTPVDDIPNSGLIGAAFGEWISEDHGWFNYKLTEPWVFKPFPKLLKCDLIVSADYDPMKGMDVKDGQAESEEENESSKINYHNLAISISILQHILQKSVEFTCYVPAFGNESDGQIMVWLAPANYRMKEGEIQQPNVNWVMSYFHANPQLFDKEGFIYRHKKQLTASTCYGSFSLMNLAGLPGNVDDDDSSGNEDEAVTVGDAGDNEDVDDNEDADDAEDAGDDEDADDVDADDDEDAGEDADDGDDDIEKEDEEEKEEGDEDNDEDDEEKDEDNDGGEDDDIDDDDDTPDIKEKKKSFQKWLSGIYRPSIYFYSGENIMNSVLYFHYTTLAPGYVGGIVSPVTMT